jgi:uncharacterized delta-60 repeat protein
MNDTHVYQNPGDYLIQAIATTTSGGTSYGELNNEVAPSSEWSTTGIANSLTSLAVQPDGSIDAIQSGAGSLPASLVQFMSGGQSDGTTFDNVTASISSISTVAIQPVAGGFDVLAGGSGYSVARFDSSGALDTTFGNAGIASPASALSTPNSGVGGVGENPQMIVEPNGNIVLAGLECAGGGDDDLILAEYLANGQPNTSFGSSGIKTYALDAAASSCDAASQPGGDIIAVVGLTAGSGSTEVLAFGSSGSLDSGFGSSGTLTTSVIKSDPLVAIQPGGQIDLAGGNGDDFAVMQYPADGSGGANWTDSDAGSGAPGALAIQPGGRIVVAVNAVSGPADWSLAGFTSAGASDTYFDELGSISGLDSSTAALAIEPNADILLAGQGPTSIIGGDEIIDAFFAQYGSGGQAVTATSADTAPTGLSVTASPATYSGADTEDGGSATPAEIEGSFTDPGAILEAHNVTIEWNGPTQDGSSVINFTVPAGQTTFDYPLPQYVANGEYTIDVSVADADGSHSISADPLTVYYSNSQPSGLTLTLANSTITEGDPVSLSGSFTDPQLNVAHLVTINWGDSTDPPDITTIAVSAGQTTFQANPNSASYTTTTGTFTISVSVSGLDGTTSATSYITVNAAPDQVMIGSVVPVAWENDYIAGSFLVTRTGDTTNSLDVSYSVKGSAVPGTDYTTLSGTVHFDANASNATITVNPSNHDLGTVVVTLSRGTGYAVAQGLSSARVTISPDTASDSGTPTAQITCFDPDGTSSGSSASTLLGCYIPIGISGSGDMTGYTFYLTHPSWLTVSASPGGSDIASGTEITVTAADTTYYVCATDSESESDVCGDVDVDVDGGEFTGETTLCASTEEFKPLQLFRDETNVTNGTPGSAPPVGDECNALVGQQINLSVYSPIPGLTFWTIPEGRINSYYVNEGNPQVGEVIPFSYNPLETNVSYTWITGGAKPVSAVLVTPFGSTSAAATINVVRPNVTPTATESGLANKLNTTSFIPLANGVPGGINIFKRYDTEITSNGVVVAQSPTVFSAGIGFYSVDGIAQPGITFRVQPAQLDSRFEFAWVQVLNKVSTTETYKGGLDEPPQSNPWANIAKELDNKFPYAGSINPTSQTGWGTSVNTYDAPYYSPTPAAMTLGGGQSYSVTETFNATMWYMCKPISPGSGGSSNWIALAKQTWGLRFTATATGQTGNKSKWQLSGYVDPIDPNNPTAASQSSQFAITTSDTDFPEWSGIAKNTPTTASNLSKSGLVPNDSATHPLGGG